MLRTFPQLTTMSNKTNRVIYFTDIESTIDPTVVPYDNTNKLSMVVA